MGELREREWKKSEPNNCRGDGKRVNQTTAAGMEVNNSLSLLWIPSIKQPFKSLTLPAFITI